MAVCPWSATHAQLLRPVAIGGTRGAEPTDAFSKYFVVGGAAIGMIEFDLRSVTSVRHATLEFVPDLLEQQDGRNPARFHVHVFAGGGKVFEEGQFLQWTEHALAETDVLVAGTAEAAVVDVTEGVRLALEAKVAYLGISFHGDSGCDLCPSGRMAVLGQHADDGTAYNNFLLRIEPRIGNPLRIVRSWPQDGYVDVRDDTMGNGKTQAGKRRGIDTVTFSFNQPVRDALTGGDPVPESFVVTESTSARSRHAIKVTAVGVAPTVDAIDLRIQLDRPIEPGMWTTIRANVVDESGRRIQPDSDRITIGFLPGDVDRSGMTGASDVLYLLDVLNGVLDHAGDPRVCDIDRNEVCNEADLERLLDLMYGANSTRPWLNTALPPKP